MADNVEIQGLEFQIQEDSAQAVSGLDKLASTLERLKTATSGGVSGLSTTAKQLEKLNTALSGLGDSSQKLTNLASGLKSLQDAGNVKLSSSVANQLNALSTALDNIKWTDGDKLTALAQGLKPLGELGRANLTSFINQLGKLPTVIEQLEAADIDKFTQQMTELAAAMKPFADEMQKVSSGFSSFPSKIQKLITSTDKYNGTVQKAATTTDSFGKVLGGVKIGSFALILRRISNLLSTAITESNAYQENLNLFTVAMGEYAEEALEYGETVSEVLGIDLSDWIRNQGVFNTLLTGFGDTADRAALMSKNLTQLGYDLSSFFNISVEDAMQKLQSGIAGELEPLRRLGYDLSQARLEQTALNLGIEKSVSSMTQAEKAELRYYAIMTQVTTAQGDLARTLEAPANQLRVLKAQFEMAARAIGNIFIPALNAILPYAIAVVQVIREIANAIASLFGFELTEVDYSGVSSLASGAEDAADSLDDAASTAKKLKQYTAGFDELNVFAPDTSSGSGSDASSVSGGFDFELPEYDFLGDAVSTRIDEIRQKMEPFVAWIKEHMDEILETVAAIGTAMLEWKIAKGITTFFKTLKGLKGQSLMYKIGFAITGLGLFLDGWSKIKEAILDIKENGSNLTNVTELISGFAEGLAVAFFALGNVKLGGAALVISGLSGIVTSISDMVNNGINFDNVTNLVENIGIFLSGIGVLTGNSVLAGGGLMLAGISLIIQNFSDVVEAFRTGDWSGVDKIELAASLLLTVGGFLTAIGKVKQITAQIGAAKSVTDTATSIGEVATAVGGSTGGGLNGTLKSLAQNLGLGVLVITEVAAAALIFVGAIALLGMELEEVGNSWEPVIENAGTVATGIAVGTGLLAAVGVAAYALGTAGTTVALNIGIGTAILLELGVTSGLFVVEIWAIGEALNQIGEAWQPVLDNGETIAEGIALGTALLIGIGVVTAALGAATVASAGLLPVAIGLGTAILVELAAAFVLFTESLVEVADELNYNLAPSLRELNGTLPTLTEDMSDFVNFMSALAGEIGSYTSSMGSITWDSIVSGFLHLFAGDPIDDLADDVEDIAGDIKNLNDKLKLANPELRAAVEMLTEYSTLMSRLQILTDANGTVELSSGMFTNLEDVGKKLVLGFNQGVSTQLPALTTTLTNIKAAIETSFDTMVANVGTKWSSNLTQMTTNFTTFQSSIFTKISTFCTQAEMKLTTFQTNVKTKSTTFYTNLQTGFMTFTINTGTSFTQFQASMATGLTQFSTSFSQSWSNLWRGVGNAFIYQWNRITDSMEKGMNNAIDSINKVLKSFNALSSLTGKTYSNISRIFIEQVAYYAEGGFPDEGQLFIARERGAEMVGQVGGHTAVANDDQIVEGITAGVSVANDGVIDAIYALMNMIEDKDLSVSIGDEVIGRSYDRYNRGRGRRVNTGAFSNAY